MYNGILHAHSGWRWIVLALVTITMLIAAIKWFSKSESMSSGIKSLVKFNTIAAHIQLIFGIILLFISPKVAFNGEAMKNAVTRFFSAEHSLFMIIAVILITIGSSVSKRQSALNKKYRTLFIFNILALLIILAMIPWPSKGYGTGWF